MTPDTLNIARVEKRTASFLIDDIVISFLFFIIFYDKLMGQLSGISLESETDIEIFAEHINLFIADNILYLFALKLIYHTFFVWKLGMTLGKYIFKIKVVEKNSNKTPTLQTAFFRAFLRIPSEMFLYVGFIVAFFSPLKQTFHDKLSGCVVVDV